MGMKPVNDEPIEILTRLGLTFCQAKIYFALVQSGESSVKTISQKSGVARAEIYRKMPSLIRSGLAEKLLGIPLRFRATPLQEGLNLLLKKENTEHVELQKKVGKLVNDFKENKQLMTQEIENQFIIIPGKDAHINWLRKTWEKTQISIEGIVTWKDHIIFNFFCNEEKKKAANRGITDREIIYVSEKEKIEYENDKTLVNFHPNLQKRIIFEPPIVLGGVFDSKQIVIATTTDNPIQTGETVFWSNNPSVIALFQNYFEILWKKALKHKNKEN